MNFKSVILMLAAVVALDCDAQLTIEQCVAKAEANYPLVRKYDLIRATGDIELADINKGWLPRIGAYGQVTGQNVVPSFPSTLSDVLERMGQDVKGLGKIQYRAGVDLTQTIWDGGASKAHRELTRSRREVDNAALETELYAVRRRVENLYFAILLIERQIALSESTRNVLMKNIEKLRSMLANGVAMQSDIDMVEAQALILGQTIAQARSSANSYRKQLELFVGENIGDANLEAPSAQLPAALDSHRPELQLYDNKISLLKVSDKLTNSSIMPKIGLFAQAYYGYPGIDYFKSMMSRDMTFNLIAGVKLSWNIDALYTKKSNRNSTALKIQEVEAEKATFDFNTKVQTTAINSTIEGLKKVIADDNRIVELRTNVRKAAESQLLNGVIDATALVTKIDDENMARINAEYHEIQLLNEIYKLKYTLNR